MIRKMKKVISCMLCVLMLFTSAFVLFSSETALSGLYLKASAAQVQGEEQSINGFSYEILDVIAKAIHEKEKSVLIQQFRHKSSQADAIIDAAKIYYSVYYGESCDGSFAYDVTYDTTYDNIIKYKFTYGENLDSSAYGKMTYELEDVTDEILKYVEGMTDFEKVLYIHDYLVISAEYYYSPEDGGDEPGLPEGMSEHYKECIMVYKSGVCSAYTYAYNYLLGLCGIETKYLSSSGMNHGWSMVKLGGEWYHVDCTWDDPVSDRIGLTRYDYFLLSDEEIADDDHNHYGWVPNTTVAQSNVYSNMPRKDSDYAAYGEGKWVYSEYVNSAYNLYVCDLYGNNPTLIAEKKLYDALDIYNGYIYSTDGKVLYKTEIANPSNSGAIYVLPEAPRSIYIDKDGNLVYFTLKHKGSLSFNVEDYGFITGLEISETQLNLESGETAQLKAALKNETDNAEDFSGNVVWKSNMTGVAAVDADGKITAGIGGNATVTASVLDYKVSCSVSVEQTKDIFVEGTLGDNITWKFNSATGHLDITGSGEMPSVSSSEAWGPYISAVTSITIAEGITSVSYYAFSGGKNVKSVYVPKTVESIALGSFYGFDSLETMVLPFVGSTRTSYNSGGMFGFIFGYDNTNGIKQYYTKSAEGLFYSYGYNIPTTIKRVVITDDESLAFGCFTNCEFIDEIEFSDATLLIGDCVFYNLSNSITVPTRIIVNNPECTVDNTYGDTRYEDRTYNTAIDDGATIYAYSNSPLHKYAAEYNLAFVALDDNKHSHSYSAVITEPSCTQGGYTTYICSCGDSYVADETPVTGHVMADAVVTKSANCLFDGEAIKVCKNCTYFETSAVSATGHSMGDYVIVSGDCLTGKVMRADCKNCDYYEKVTDTTQSHNYSAVVTQPTCTKGGYTTYTCACGDSYVADETLALGHSYSNWTQTKAPTCSAKGEERRDCTVCEHFETRELPKTAHSYTTKVTQPTCTKGGYTTYTCTCGDSYVADETLALGHSYSSWTQTKAPTCSAKGEERRDCTVCEHFETRELPKTAHSYTSKVTQPTCTKGGYTTYTCSCGDSYVADETLALGHSYSSWAQTKAPTCSAKGEERRDCTVCEHYETRELPKAAHSYTTKVTQPTCTKGGYTTYTCTCGDSYVADETLALGHSYSSWAQTKAPTCSAKGEERRDCTVCEHYETRELPKTAHSYTTKVTQPTCTKSGYTTDTCAKCGNTVTYNHISAKGHSDANEDKICDVCGEVLPEKAPSENCDCMCHEGGFIGFIWKIVRFFQKLFGMNKTCKCGVTHY